MYQKCITAVKTPEVSCNYITREVMYLQKCSREITIAASRQEDIVGQMDTKMYERVLARKASQGGIPLEKLEDDVRTGLLAQWIFPPPHYDAEKNLARMAPD